MIIGTTAYGCASLRYRLARARARGGLASLLSSRAGSSLRPLAVRALKGHNPTSLRRGRGESIQYEARASGPREDHTCPAPARDARGRGVARIVVGSELDFEPRLFTCTRAADGRRASGTVVRLFDAVCFENCVAGGRGCVRGEFSNSATDQKRARCPTPAFVEINEQSPRLKITSSPAAASVAPPHFPVDINAASTAQRGLAWTKNSLNRQLPIFKLAFSARLRAFRVRSSAPVGANPPSALTTRRRPSAPQHSLATPRKNSRRETFGAQVNKKHEAPPQPPRAHAGDGPHPDRK